MTNNDVFRRLRYALNLDTKSVIEIFRLSEMKMGQADITSLVKKEEEDGFVACSDAVLEAFLDGLIARNRGKREGEPEKPAEPVPLTNNDILKKIRIAMALREEEMLALFNLAQFPVSKGELGAVFRAKGQENYKPCGDQMLRNFLKGLTVKCREEAGKEARRR